MSELFPASQTDNSDEENDGELQFARCSQSSVQHDELPLMEPVNPMGSSEKARTELPAAPNVSAGDKDELPLNREGAHQPNVRRSNLIIRCSLISLVISLITGALVYFAARLHSEREMAARFAASASSSTVATGVDEASAKEAEQIAALQKQVDVMRREQLIMQQNTRESLESISTALNTAKVAPVSAPSTSAQPGVARIAEMKPDVSPTQQEFIQLKERNRLTQYADETIATGMRKPLEVLVEYLRDPDSKHLHEAAQAEYLRAVRGIQLIQREDPGYRLPVAELFKDQNIRDEADVKPDALLKLLADHQQSWEVRVRVCFLLLGSNLPETNAKLIQAIKEDPSLDVAKHAQLALEQRIKRRFRLFDIPMIEEWVKSQGK